MVIVVIIGARGKVETIENKRLDLVVAQSVGVFVLYVADYWLPHCTA